MRWPTYIRALFWFSHSSVRNFENTHGNSGDPSQYTTAKEAASVITNERGVQLIAERNPQAAFKIFRELATTNDPDALNNVGVHYLRGTAVKRNHTKAQQFFQRAAAQNHIVARYNLALMLPNRHDTPDDVIKRQLELLEPNIKAGDIPSHVLLANFLRFKNRDRLVPDREKRKHELLKVAAGSGDPDYLILYGEILEVEAFKTGNTEMMIDAISQYQKARDAGSVLAAERLGNVRHLADPAFNAALPGILRRSRRAFLFTSANGGIITAKCDVGLDVFSNIGRYAASLRHTINFDILSREIRETINDRLSGISEQEKRLALGFLKECADAEAKPRQRNPPFGTSALYAWKIKPSTPDLLNSPDWAKLNLGLMYALGIYVDQNDQIARSYLEATGSKKRWEKAEFWLRYLEEKHRNSSKCGLIPDDSHKC